MSFIAIRSWPASESRASRGVRKSLLHPKYVRNHHPGKAIRAAEGWEYGRIFVSMILLVKNRNPSSKKPHPSKKKKVYFMLAVGDHYQS